MDKNQFYEGLPNPFGWNRIKSALLVLLGKRKAQQNSEELRREYNKAYKKQQGTSINPHFPALALHIA